MQRGVRRDGGERRVGAQHKDRGSSLEQQPQQQQIVRLPLPSWPETRPPQFRRTPARTTRTQRLQKAWGGVPSMQVLRALPLPAAPAACPASPRQAHRALSEAICAAAHAGGRGGRPSSSSAAAEAAAGSMNGGKRLRLNTGAAAPAPAERHSQSAVGAPSTSGAQQEVRATGPLDVSSG